MGLELILRLPINLGHIPTMSRLPADSSRSEVRHRFALEELRLISAFASRLSSFLGHYYRRFTQSEVLFSQLSKRETLRHSNTLLY